MSSTTWCSGFTCQLECKSQSETELHNVEFKLFNYNLPQHNLVRAPSIKQTYSMHTHGACALQARMSSTAWG